MKLNTSIIIDPIVHYSGLRHSTLEYYTLQQSVLKHGILLPILVRKHLDIEDQDEDYYEIIDGLQRFHAHRTMRNEELIDCRIIEADDLESMKIQVTLNYDTAKPIQMALHLLRILQVTPRVTLEQLTLSLCVPDHWIIKTLKLNFDEVLMSDVSTGKINLSNACALNKLKDEHEQMKWRKRAREINPLEFAPLIMARVRELKEARRR